MLVPRGSMARLVICSTGDVRGTALVIPEAAKRLPGIHTPCVGVDAKRKYRVDSGLARFARTPE
jgi:hypothetical protein